MDYAGRVLELTKASGGMRLASVNEAARLYKKMRDLKDEIEELLKALNGIIDEAKQVVMPALFKDAGVTSVTVDGYRFTISHTVRASIPPDTKPLAYKWLRENDLGELIIETVNSSTLAAQARQMMEDGSELPDEYFKVALVPNVSVTKAG